MSELFLIGDTHIAHEKIVEYREFTTVAMHDYFITKMINNTCGKNDTLLLVGDIAFKKPNFHNFMQNLDCKKQFILGNHDKWGIDLYRGYGKVLPYLIKHDIIITHIPIHPSELIHNGGRWKLNIHAHRHDKEPLGEGYFCVSAEVINYKPITIAEILCQQ